MNKSKEIIPVYITASLIIWFCLIGISFITAVCIDAMEKWPSAVGNITTLWCIVTTIISLLFPIVSIWFGVYWLLHIKDKQ